MRCIALEIDLLYEKFLAAKNSDEVSECIVKALEILKNSAAELPDADLAKLYGIRSRIDILPYQTMKMLHEKNYKRAELFIYSLTDSLGSIPKDFCSLMYILGRVNYELGDYERAAKFFGVYNVWRMELWNDFDELGLFYRANSLVLAGRGGYRNLNCCTKKFWK